MKKKLLVLLLVSFFSFGQNSKQIIQNYINDNLTSLHVSNSEKTNWIVGSETTSETMQINNFLVYQTVAGIKVDNPKIYFWLKNNQIINEPSGFINNVTSKVNTTSPVLNVTAALKKSLIALSDSDFNATIISQDGNKYKLTNGLNTNDPVNAELVYKVNDNNTLTLAWNLEYYSQVGNHLWKVKIDAVNGNMIEKQDLTHNCYFGPKHNHDNCAKPLENNNFSLFKESSSALSFTPGTTNYRVIPFNFESPNHSPRVLITNPEATTILAPSTLAASPNGWHNTNGIIGGSSAATRYNITRGNNVWAKDDVDANNTGGISPTGTGAYPNLTFDFPYGGNGAIPSSYLNAATTNLFYMNNIMHDVWYQYGFNEVNRNFQVTNYGRGGIGNDAVSAESQDGSQIPEPTLNNANFSTPSEGSGSTPRMQMFLWNRKKASNLVVNTGSLAATNYFVNDNTFSPGNVPLPVAPSALTANIVLFDDGVGPDTSDACTAATPANAAALNGKIAVIRRGDCSFASKVKLAQNAGAIGVIIVNNVPGRVGMAGADATITIPAVSMTQADGEALIASLASGGPNSVEVSLSDPESYINGDGDFDNGIIAHEYGHGVSTRLVGGGGGLGGSSEQPGEGWSDWLWLIMQIKTGDTRNDDRGIATYSDNQPVDGVGIRQYIYSTDMSTNPHTFASTNNQTFQDANGFDVVSVHGMGSIWCVMLWDLTWNYIDKYGYNSNIYNGTGGNNKVMRLIIDAMKLTPANPSLIQCRDAIIAADQNTTGGQDYCLIWQTFARRGMGVNASSGSKTGILGAQDQVEDFTEPAPGPNCTFLAATTFSNEDLVKVYPNPTSGILNLNIANYTSDIKVEMFDLNGRKVLSENINDFSTQRSINIQSLQTGMYLLKITGDNLSYSQKIIKNN